MIALILMAIDLTMTILRRTEKTLYVSVWYFTMTFFWTIGFYPIGNVMWHPATGSLNGLLDSLLLWSYGHNLPGLLLTPLSLGAAYFVLPRVTKAPIYSHTLSLYAFWTLVALYSHIGGHHILQAPIPNWLKVMSVVDSFIMVIPVFAVLFNLWLSARGRGGALLADPAGRFIIGGTVFYLLTCIQGPVQSLPSVQRVTHFTNWTIGHSHLAVLGFVGFMATRGTVARPAACYRAAPLLRRSCQFAIQPHGLRGHRVSHRADHRRARAGPLLGDTVPPLCGCCPSLPRTWPCGLP